MTTTTTKTVQTAPTNRQPLPAVTIQGLLAAAQIKGVATLGYN